MVLLSARGCHNVGMNTEWSPLPSRDELLTAGKAARQRTPRRRLAELASGPRDPLGIIAAQNTTRIPELVPLRTERMAASAFAFYRGTAALMAADLADAPHSGILVASCGDAHVSNFGFYASQQRSLMFDLNDFDEAAWAPWEWDVKRLATSIVIGGRATARSAKVVDEAVRAALTTYTTGIAKASALSPTDRYFTHFDVEASQSMFDKASRKAVRTSIRQAQRRTGERAVRKLTTADADGRRLFQREAPTMTDVEPVVRGAVHDLIGQYRSSTSADIALLLDHYTISDVVRRVVGVGSVGTRCYLVLFQDGDDNTVLLQPKQASRSVLVEYGRIPQPERLATLIETSGEGARVVDLQRVLQGLSDPFLGYLRGPNADYYVRQFHDMKGGVEIEQLDDTPFISYARACAAVVARAHSQSVTAAEVAGYVGRGRRVTASLLEWAHDYADVSRADYDAFVAARQAEAAPTP